MLFRCARSLTLVHSGRRGVVFGNGPNQVCVTPTNILVAIEKLRLSARKKLKLPMPAGAAPSYTALK